ncbi:MAG: MFS transporter [Trueperella sp.]|nr:MFS transporter [Trueperella sp.]
MSKPQIVNESLEKWLKIFSTLLISLVAFETVAVATAMPFVVEILHGENFYALASGVALAAQMLTTVLAGPWCDTRGPKPSLYTGTLLFIAGLLVATAAPSVQILIVGRAIQGLGGGLMVVPLYVLVSAHVAPARQPAFFALFSAAWVLPSMVGPVIAGYLVDYVHWRWVFGMTPLLLAFVLPFSVMKIQRFPNPPLQPAPKRAGKIAIFAIGTASMVGLLQVLSGTEAGEFDWQIFAAILLATVATFVLVRPLLPPGSLRAANPLGATVLMRGMLNGTFLTVEIFLPLMLKNIHGWGPTQAGIVLTAGSFSWALGSWIQGRIFSQTYRALLPFWGTVGFLLGILIASVGILPQVPGWMAIFGWLIAGLGIGTIYPALTVHALEITPPGAKGATSSAVQVADTMGAALCIAYGGIIFAVAGGGGPTAFFAVIGLMAAILILALFVSNRVGVMEGYRNE